MKRVLWIVLAATIMGALKMSPACVLAQEIKKGKGFLVKKENNQLILKEYDEVNKSSLEITYITGADTVFKNFQSLDEILEYDVLEIEYSDVQGQRKASTIFKKLPAQELFDQMEYDPNMMDDIQEISDEYRA